MIQVADEYKTVQKIIDDRASISRFGDGELKLCIGRKQMLQDYSPKIKAHLRSVLKSDLPSLLVGIPRIYSSDYPIQDDDKRSFWKQYNKPMFRNLYDKSVQYYSAFITRPDSAQECDRDEYWDLVKKIWLNRKVVLLQGRGREFHRHFTLFETAVSLEIVYGPRSNAYEQIDQLVDLLMSFSRDCLFVLSLGPTATVLAYEMAQLNRQALDLGHMGVFFSNQHPKSSQYTGEYYDVDK